MATTLAVFIFTTYTPHSRTQTSIQRCPSSSGTTHSKKKKLERCRPPSGINQQKNKTWSRGSPQPPPLLYQSAIPGCLQRHTGTVGFGTTASLDN